MLGLATFVMRSRWSAITVFTVFLALGTFVLPVLVLACAVAALVTLRNGVVEGLLVVVIGTLLTFTFAALGSPHAHVVSVIGVSVGVTVIPVWIAASVLRRQADWPLALAAAALLCGFWVTVVYAVLDSPAAWWAKQLEIEMAGAQNIPEGRDLSEMIAQFAPHMTGLLGAMLLLFCILGLMLGRWWQSLLYNPGGFRKEFLALRLKRTHALVLLGFVAIGWFGGESIGLWAADIGSILIAMFIFPGVALAHVWASQSPYSSAALAGFYIAVVIIPHMAAALGWMDTWLDLRTRWMKHPTNGTGSG